ncbi:CHAP domain-containing protein [Kineosporia sp. A_224]|uniref:CHAP domain-containing protein n=1 Tax=Kineosporia sp. A_224 TaxID=1962180 RepID=UPI00117B1039|nr:CHAP domain-containing protein [Kineosporia sp. A_224]
MDEGVLSRRGTLSSPRSGRWAALLVAVFMAVSSCFALIGTSASAAVGDNYPSRSLPDCSFQFGVYSWCAGTPGANGKYPAGAWASGRGYAYRNCTDWASFHLQDYYGVPDSVVRGLQNGGQWATGAKARGGYLVNKTPAVGAAVVRAATYNPDGTLKTFGHVAVIDAVNPDKTTFTISQYNGAGTGKYSTATGTMTSLKFTDIVHFEKWATRNVSGSSSSVAAVGAISTITHGSRVGLSWQPVAGATGYRVLRDGAHVGTVAAAPYFDRAVSVGQHYTYSVVAMSGADPAPGSSVQISTTWDSADHAYLRTKAGPSECGRAGDATHQYLVCNTLTATGWVSGFSQVYDWGYATDRAWVSNPNGTVSYCRTFIEGKHLVCDTWNGATWTGPKSSGVLDTGYRDAFA